MIPMDFMTWARKWSIPTAALDELIRLSVHLGPSESGLSEAAVSSRVRLEYAREGKYLWRNQRGAGKMASGNFIRFGLANDSERLGDVVKSADFIGIERVQITAEMVGSSIGRFLSVEIKRGDWSPTYTKEECAQFAWAALINGQGGRAVIVNSTGSV